MRDTELERRTGTEICLLAKSYTLCDLHTETICMLHISSNSLNPQSDSFPYLTWSCVSSLLSVALVEELLKTPVVRVAGTGWSSWETWSTCSQSCAKGYRTRRRTCGGPEGKSAPVACRGSPVEYQDCNVQACPGE